MSLPRAVLAAEEKANQALQQLKAAREAPQEQVVVSEPPAQIEASTEEVQAPTAEPAEVRTEAPIEAPPAEEDQKWEARYRSLNGKYQAEVPRLAAANKELQTQLQRLQREMEELKTAKPREALVKPEEVQEYGEPLVDLIRRAAREEVAEKDAVIHELRARLDSFESTSNRNVEVSFYENLNAMVPDWTDVNSDVAFHQWLDQYDELAGRRRQDLLKEAEEARDASRVANFFNAWKKTTGQRAATSAQKLESQVVPQGTASAAKPVGKKIWTRSEIAEFYRRARSGELDSKQMVAIEADIHAAQLERRIR